MGRLLRPVVGCGSVVVDIFQAVQRFPARGAKGYVARGAPRPRRSAGGVCLNHLAWAAAVARTPAALLARIGQPDTDADAACVLRAMRGRGVADRHVVRSAAYRTPTSLVFTDGVGDAGHAGESGIRCDAERTIIMDPASTAATTPVVVRELWTGAIQGASVVSTEVSQLPLAAAAEVFKLAREARALTVLDMDVPPEVACCEHDAGLGSADELARLLTLADVIKSSHSVALALCHFLGGARAAPSGRASADVTVDELMRALPVRPKLLILTEGARPTVAITKSGLQLVVHVPPLTGQAGHTHAQIDVTGSGDAFTGGCLAWLYHNQCIPADERSLEEMLTLANVCGRACTLIVDSALPPASTPEFSRFLAGQHPLVSQFLSRAETGQLDRGVAAA
jgi:sugar/nucleoside kinase (ribokinase family)